MLKKHSLSNAMKPLLVGLSALSTLGCASTDIFWDHPTKGDAEFSKDQYECRRDAAFARREESIRLGLMCMEDGGGRGDDLTDRGLMGRVNIRPKLMAGYAGGALF